MKNSNGHRLVLLGTTFAYFLITIEIIIMISPFALYFYSVYGPILNFFGASPLTSWTTEFFLPHMVFPDDKLINFISYLQVTMLVGLLLFFSAAIPLYYGRFTGRGVVQMSFYAKIRHPQYLFLAISGFGLLLYWPRFIILIMYITMLFVYYILARNEEWRMQLEHPDEYEKYMQNIPMFLPGEPGGRFYDLTLGWLKPKWLGILFLYLTTLVVAVFLAIGVRSYTINGLPIVVTADNITVVPVFPRPAEDVKKIYAAALASAEVRTELKKEHDANLAYIMPGDFFLTALVTDKDRRFSDEMIERFPEILEWHQYKFSGGLGKFFRIFYSFVKTLGTVETDYDIERLVFVRVRDRNGQTLSSSRIFDLGVKRTPALIVDIDADSLEVLSVLPTSDNHKWGKMPMPVF
jgi:protein-S-isoprenylcysteine O-methyltransferase Ste14